MKKKSSFIRWIRMMMLWGIGLLLLTASAVAIRYIGALSTDIEKRFAGRRWDIPSRVYSDTWIVYPGQSINLSLFHQKLHRLGYREVPHLPVQQGEMRRTATSIDIFLHDFSSPFYQQKNLPIRIRLMDNLITDIMRIDTQEKLPILELEPEELMLYFGPDRERRLVMSSRDLPPHLINAVLAAEDHLFYKHHGIAIRGILRAFITNIREGTIAQGGSTITQQLAKNYFLTPERTLKRKFKELLISFIIEYRYSKDEILEIYLNEIYYGQKGSVSINGIGEAAQFYFDKAAGDLSLPEAATLAGLIKAPNHYSPYVDKSKCLERRNAVLRAMLKRKWLSDDAYQNAVSAPLTPAGYTGYRRRAPYFMDYLTSQLTEFYSHDALASEGLGIYTTLDTQVQQATEQALNNGLSRLESTHPSLKGTDTKNRLQGIVIVMQPKTGYILAMVGGRDYGISQFNRATHAMRQPGSAFKPFVFLSGLGEVTLATKLSNTPQTFNPDGMSWRPKNFNPNAEPIVTVREALTYSHNIATVNLALTIGIEKLIDTFRPFEFNTRIDPYPSAALGAFEVKPIELARAYCVFAANGVLPHPLSIKQVVNEQGNTIQRRHLHIKSLISPAEAYMVSDLLRGVVISGTGRSLASHGVTWPVAGKTGTTNGYRDAWFVGYTPTLLALVWVGFDNGDSVHSTGAQAALPIWADLMDALPQYQSGDWFTVPPGIIKQPTCLDSGKNAEDQCCPNVTEELYLEKTQLHKCPQHPCASSLDRLWKGLKRIAP